MTLTDELLEELVERIVREVHPSRIYLFGSRAEGTARPDSDLDLMIVGPEESRPAESRWRQLQRVRKSLREFRSAKDILIYSEEEFQTFRRSLNHIAVHAAKEGRLLYARQ